MNWEFANPSEKIGELQKKKPSAEAASNKFK
jgi:hypothetical protein